MFSSAGKLVHLVLDRLGNNDSFSFFHEWDPDERWGAHRTDKIRVVAIHVFCILIIAQTNKMVFRPVDVS